MILVVGPGRCGTSAVAGRLCDLGVFMCSTVESDETNPDGYFEDVEFNAAAYFVDDVTAGDVDSYVRLDAGVRWKARPNVELAASELSTPADPADSSMGNSRIKR